MPRSSACQSSRTRARVRRLWAGALCAASFVAGQALFGAPPAPLAGPTASDVWRQYQTAKGAVSQAAAPRPAQISGPVTAPAALLGQPAKTRTIVPEVVQATALAPVITPAEANQLRQSPTPAAVRAVPEKPAATAPPEEKPTPVVPQALPAGPAVAPEAATPVHVAARPLPLPSQPKAQPLPPIVSATNAARPKSKQPAGPTTVGDAPLTIEPVGASAPAVATPSNLFVVPRVADPIRPRAESLAPLAPNRAEPVFIAQPAAPAPLPAGPVIGELPVGSPFEAIRESGQVTLRVGRSLLMRTKVDIYRTAIVDESVCDVVQFTPREVSLIGRAQGSTHVTFWFDDPNSAPLTYLIKVEPDPQAIKTVETKYQMLEDLINEMFPDSKIRLVVMADKLLVKGQAKDPEEAAQIMTVIRAQYGGNRGGMGGGMGGMGGGMGMGGLADGLATTVLPSDATGRANQPGYRLINMLRVPGIQQVALKVKIAELNRTAARGFGVNLAANIDIGEVSNGTQLVLATLLNPASSTSIIGTVENDDLVFGIRYLQEHGVARLLSEPTLVTMSGRPATFVAGGEFAVPTIVGSVGLNAVTTDFRAFGAIISFLPTVIDKDHIRLQVAPEFSQINAGLAVNGTPGLNVRSATTTVEMREGQTLAIAGLIEDNYKADQVGNLPFLARVFGRRDASRNETELIILVTPELVHPMDAEEVPPLPGFDVTEPNANEFFLHGQLEGVPTRTHRTTVWPQLRKRYGAGGPAMTSGPFGHGQ